MTLMGVITWVALFAIGFYAGFSYSNNKALSKIKKLKRHIDELENPLDHSDEK